MDTWRLVDLEYDSPFMNLATEEAIFREVGEGMASSTIRFWRNKNAVVIGRFQRITRETNLGACRKHGTAIVRRFTGGGAVYHDQGNLNYALSIPRDHPLVQQDISMNFRNFLFGVIEGLSVLGLKAEFKPTNKIEVSGSKISGAAGCLKSGAFFLHGSLLVHSNLKVLSQVLDAPQVEHTSGFVRSNRRKVTTVQNELGEDISVKEAKIALKTGFETSYGIKLIESSLESRETSLAEELYQRKYSTEKWNLHGK